MAQQIPIQDGLFEHNGDGWQLLGSRCPSCSETIFPAQADCRHCGNQQCHSFVLGDRGTLWTWTVQEFRPKTPYLHSDDEAEFVPYGVGYIEMACGLKVESRLSVNQPAQLAIGMEMSLTVIPFHTREDGTQLLTFEFSPTTGSAL